MTIPLQTSCVYGPIASRRFGSSLGINVLPVDRKVCNFDCVYCQYGPSAQEKDFSFPSVDEIEASVKDYFSRMQDRPAKTDWVMISGNGEPTLHPEFPRIVDSLVHLRDIHLAGVPLGVLSNASTCGWFGVQAALLKLDGCFMKLDAGNPFVFQRLNAPQAAARSGFQWAEIINGLYRLPKTVIESLFVAGRIDNTGDREVEDWIQAVNYIRPESVQVYTISRPTRVEGILPVEKRKLDRIAECLSSQTGIPAAVYI